MPLLLWGKDLIRVGTDGGKAFTTMRYSTKSEGLARNMSKEGRQPTPGSITGPQSDP
jgi:hypothetical protein